MASKVKQTAGIGKGTPGPGRPKGSVNKVNADVKAMILQALDGAGGAAFDELSGVSFLPMDGGTYRQAPYQECSKEEYEAMAAKMPEEIYWEVLQQYELEDSTTSARELACVAGACEVL